MFHGAAVYMYVLLKYGKYIGKMLFLFLFKNYKWKDNARLGCHFVCG